MSMLNLFSPLIDNVTGFIGFLTIIPLGVIPQGYKGYYFKELTQEHIGKIYKINNTFLAHREKLLSGLFPDATKINEFTFGNYIFRLCIKRYGIYEVGYWEYCGMKKSMPNSWYVETEYTTSSDIISLVATYYNYTFIETIELIYGHISTNTTLYPHVIKGKGGYKEELFPIAKKFNDVKWNNNFIQQLERHGAILSSYSLNNSIIFLYKYCYKNIHNQYVEIFFGYFHRYNSTQNTFIAMDISQFNRLDFQQINKLAYDIELQETIKNYYINFKKQIYFLLLDLPDNMRENPLHQLPSNFPYGIMIKNINYLYQFDFSTLKEHIVFIEIDVTYYKDKKILLSSLEKLKEIEKKYHIDFFIYFIPLLQFFDNSFGNENNEMNNYIMKFFSWSYGKSYLRLLSLQNFSSSEVYREIVIDDIKENKQKEIQQKSLSSAFSLAKDGFANQNRKVESILSPIINSGQVIWLFAPEKIGKTFLAMSIAYVVSRGNSSVCGWQSNGSKKVLYIDGEMSGVGLKKIYSRIVQGFQQENNDNILFDSFLFSESDEEYETILDPAWLEEFQPKLYDYDLIILDSYYSLNNNSRSLKEFFAFLRDLKKHNVAVLVIDHTNRNEELQGSIDKRRFTDLGIQLHYGKAKGEISISYEFDRNGIVTIEEPKRFYKDFSNNVFRFVEIKDKLTREERIELLEYILYSVHKVKQKELAIKFTDGENYKKRISEHCKTIKEIIVEKEDNDKYHCDLLRAKYQEYIELTKDNCFEKYKELLKDSGVLKEELNEVKTDSKSNFDVENVSNPIEHKNEDINPDTKQSEITEQVSLINNSKKDELNIDKGKINSKNSFVKSDNSNQQTNERATSDAVKVLRRKECIQ